MKKILLIFSLITSVLAVRAQSVEKLTNLADRYYESKKYVDAVEFYERIHQVNPEDKRVHLRWALSLYHSLHYDEAIAQLKQLLASGYKEEQALYYYGWLLKTDGQYKRADSVFDILARLPEVSNKYKTLGDFQQKGCKLGIRMLKIKNIHQLHPMEDVNSRDHDFGLIEHPQGYVVLSSTRKTDQKQFYDGQFGGLLPNMIGYSPSKNNKSNWVPNEKVANLNSEWAQGTGCFDKTGNAFYFSSCNENDGCKIFVSKTDDNGHWSAPTPLNSNINKPGYDTKQPNTSITGDTLFFVSNRPGGWGGTDIWMSFKLKEDEWAPAVNLGGTINTTADEMSPYYSSAFESLLFASNGHAGYGGFDLYMAKGRSFFAPDIFNIGPPFNSPYDDNYFSLGKKGYITSNRNHSDFDIFTFIYTNEVSLLKSFMTDESLIDLLQQSPGSLDLYSFRHEEFEDYHMLQPAIEPVEKNTTSTTTFGKIKGQGVPESVIRLSLNNSQEMLTLVSKEETFEIRMLPDTLKDHRLTQNKTPIDFKLDTMTFEGFQYRFEKIYFDFDSHSLRDESKESLNDLIKIFKPENIVMVDIHTHTDHLGQQDYNYALSENRGLSILRFLHQQGISYNQIRVFPNGEKNLLSNYDTWYSRLLNRRAEIVVYTRQSVNFPKPEVFIVRKNIGISQASSSLKIPDGKLHEWNGLSDDISVLKEGHILRVFDPKHLAPDPKYLIPEEIVDNRMIIYKTKTGDTLSNLAKRFGTIEEVIAEENNITTITPGQELIIYLLHGS